MTLISAGDNSVSSFISGTRLPDWACVKFAEMLRFGVQGTGYARPARQAFRAGYRG
jgi:hypothetical protein